MSELEPIALRVVISGMPHPQPRPRWVAGQGMVSTLAARVKTWRMRVAHAVSEAIFEVGENTVELLHDGALSLHLDFRIPIKGKYPHWIGMYHHTAPDTDNLAKPIMDELQRAKALPNDGRIAELVVRKQWCAPKDAGCTVLLQKVPAPFVGIRYENGPKWLTEIGE